MSIFINSFIYAACPYVSNSWIFFFFLNGSTALVGPRLFSVFWSIFLQSAGLLEWVISSSQGPLGAWGSLTCTKFTTRVKQLEVAPGGLVPWMFPSLKIRRPPPGLSPRRSSHEVGTLPLDYGGRCIEGLPKINMEIIRADRIMETEKGDTDQIKSHWKFDWHFQFYFSLIL
jgi:hypothetical protein